MISKSGHANSFDCRGVPTSYADPDAHLGLERAHMCALNFFGDAIQEIDKVIEAHPKFIFAYLFRLGWLTQAMERRVNPKLESDIQTVNGLMKDANARERAHFSAIECWLNGEFHKAVLIWSAILDDNPHDLFALQLAHLSSVLLGDARMQRDVVSKVLPKWNDSIQGYEFVLGFYAFGLEENGQFGKAEEIAFRSLELRENNPYAVHTVSHVMEMQGRQKAGVQFMTERAGLWDSSNFSNHLWWHTALYHLDLDDFESALNIYDNGLRRKAAQDGAYEDLDSAALLWRMKLLGADVGDRWVELAEKWAHSAEDALYAFNDIHAMMAFVGAEMNDHQERLLLCNEGVVKAAQNDNAGMTRNAGLPFCQAIQDFHNRQYDKCVDKLLPLRGNSHYIGGSAAQQDVIGWTLVEASIRAGKAELALSLAQERCKRKPSSLQNWKFVSRAAQRLGDQSLVSYALEKVSAIGAANA